MALVAIGLYLGGVLYSGWAGGVVGDHLGQGLRLLVGGMSVLVPLLCLVLGVLVLVRSELVDPGPFRAGLYLLVPSLLLAWGAGRFGLGAGAPGHDELAASQVVEHGGWLGGGLYWATYGLFGDAGTTIVCVLGLLLGLLFTTGSSVQAATRWWAGRVGDAATVAGQHTRVAAARVGVAAEQAREQIQAAQAAREAARPFDGSSSFPDLFGDVPSTFARATSGGDEGAGDLELPADEVASRQEPAGEAGPNPAVEAPETGKARRRRAAAGVAGEEQLALLEPDADDAGDEAAGGEAEEPPTQSRRASRTRGERASETVLRARVTDGYELPSPSLLKAGSKVATTRPADVDKTKKLLVETFGHFGIAAEIVGMVPGPRVSRYELRLEPGTKMSKVENLRKDLAYALATTEIRILAPIPGKSAVGIEVENPRPAVVTLGDIRGERPKGSSPLHVWFGKDITGDVIGADLAKMPHLLVAGTTGAGKSGCMNAMLSSIVLGATPDEVKMLLIDPKKVELSTYEGLPHLMAPVVTNMKKAANALGNVVAQMEERYSSMELAGARSLDEYNKVRIGRGDEPVPYVLVVVDELADLVMQAKADVEDAVIRVAQKGRAAGFHLVLATQRPSVDVITGMIKSNVPSRVAFAVSSQTDSRVILDQNGAETLLGSGDMLFKPVWSRQVQRVQGAWISEPEVRALCDAAREQREPEFDEDLLREPEQAPAEADADFVDQDDRLGEAIRLVAEFQTCSASFFQRRMRVGYTRGARLVDMLERRGIVAPGEGPRPRNVLVTGDDVPRLLSELGDEVLAGDPGA